MKNYLLFLMFVIVLCFSSCKKDTCKDLKGPFIKVLEKTHSVVINEKYLGIKLSKDDSCVFQVQNKNFPDTPPQKYVVKLSSGEEFNCGVMADMWGWYCDKVKK